MIFDSENMVENKLIILYALNHFKLPLTKEQISQIILENVQISYFDLQFLMDSLYKDEFISKYDKDQVSLFSISEKGINTLNLFIDRIPAFIKNILNLYISKNKDNILKHTRLYSNYKKEGDKDFKVTVKLFENDICIIDLSINVATKDQAEFICSNWKKSGQKIYPHLIDSLINKY